MQKLFHTLTITITGYHLPRGSLKKVVCSTSRCRVGLTNCLSCYWFDDELGARTMTRVETRRWRRRRRNSLLARRRFTIIAWWILIFLFCPLFAHRIVRARGAQLCAINKESVTRTDARILRPKSFFSPQGEFSNENANVIVTNVTHCWRIALKEKKMFINMALSSLKVSISVFLVLRLKWCGYAAK